MDRISCIILNGGKGIRLRPYTLKRSKALVPIINNIPITELLLKIIVKGLDIDQITFGTKGIENYIDIQNYFRSFAEINNKKINFQYSDPNYYDSGSADCTKNIIDQYSIEEYILVVSNDSLFDPKDISNMVTKAIKDKNQFVIAATETGERNISDYGHIQVNENNEVKKFIEKPKNANELDGQTYISAGIYLIGPKYFKYLIDDFGKDTLPRVLKEGKIHIHKFDNRWLDVGTIKNYRDTFNYFISEKPEYFQSFLENYYIKLDNLDVWIRSDGSKQSEKYYNEIVSMIKREQVTINGNVYIGQMCKIKPGITLENVSIGDFCRVGAGTTIKNSNVLDGWSIGENCLLEDSILGRLGLIQSHSIIKDSFLGDDLIIGSECNLQNVILKGHSTIPGKQTLVDLNTLGSRSIFY